MINQNLLSDLIVHLKYARYLPDQNRRETYEEIVDRNLKLHKTYYAGNRVILAEIDKHYQLVYDKNVLPSMRAFQFSGKAIIRHPNRIYNCAYAPIDHPKIFSEILFLLLGGTGVGYSVQRKDVEKLPSIQHPNGRRRRRFLIGDSIEGWSDAINVLLNAYFYRKSTPIFDYSDIRPQGSPLVTAGGVAPGPQPLKTAIHEITAILDKKEQDTQLTPIEAHDIVCYMADAVLAGGIRRAALISLFSFDDEEMTTSKFGPWWELNPQRSRSNNSAVILRHRVKEDDFKTFVERAIASKSGEPGVFFSNEARWGCNPCAEISLRPHQFCNLTEINTSDVVDMDDFASRCEAASFIGTLQAGYTDFHYLRDVWRRTTEKDALVGVGLTGLASRKLTHEMLIEGANVVTNTNSRISSILGINKAARCTTVKPSGTSSLVLSCSSGCHAWHSKYYIRTIRVKKKEAIYEYLRNATPSMVEDDYFKPNTDACIRIPIKAPEGALTRNEETSLEFLDRVGDLNNYWVKNGHRSGANKNNVSATVNVKNEEWSDIMNWMWKNRKLYNGLSLIPYDGGTYKQMPLEECDEQEYERRLEMIEKELNGSAFKFSSVVEFKDDTNLKGEIACAGGSCEVV